MTPRCLLPGHRAAHRNPAGAAHVHHVQVACHRGLMPTVKPSRPTCNPPPGGRTQMPVNHQRVPSVHSPAEW